MTSGYLYKSSSCEHVIISIRTHLYVRIVRCYVLALVALGGPLKTNMFEFLSFSGVMSEDWQT